MAGAVPDEREVHFTWDGRRVCGRDGEAVAAALWRAGVLVQARSIKYHRPRGPQCFAGGCPGCLVRVGGVPNQRGCEVPVREGLRVEGQTGWPSASRDLFSIVDRLFVHLDHERAFVRPWPVRAAYEAIARRLSGFGARPTGEMASAPGDRIATDVLVAGAGPAGLGAAIEAARAGARVLVVGSGGLGGQLLHTPGPVDGGPRGTLPGPALAQDLGGEAAALGVRAMAGAVLGLYEDGIAVAETAGDGLRVHHVAASATVIATGATEGPVLVPGNDTPGVLGARAARILLNRWGVSPGSHVVAQGGGRQGTAFAMEARAAGLEVTVVGSIKAIRGGRRVKRVETPSGDVPADAVVLDAGLTPTPELAQQAGLPFTFEAALGGRVPLSRHDGSTPLPHVYVAGSCAGVHDPAAALAQGRFAGARAAGSKFEAGARGVSDFGTFEAAELAALRRVWGSR